MTDPDTTGQIKTVGFIGTATGGNLGDFQNPPLTSNKVLLKGASRLCLFRPCQEDGSVHFDVPLSLNDCHTGVGVGGLMTKGGNGELRISIEAALWTLGSDIRMSNENETPRLRPGRFVLSKGNAPA